MKKAKMKVVPEIEPENESYWCITVGFYPGILFGIRTYDEPTFSTHVLYLPFVDIAIEISK
jgi:hypothetical protein